MRLGMFEEIRKNRGSAIQVLSNSGPPPMSEEVRELAASYLPEGIDLKGQDDIVDFIFSYDVVGTTRAALAATEP